MKSKRKPIATTLNTVYLWAHSEEALERIYVLTQDPAVIKTIFAKTIQSANQYYPLMNVQNKDGLWSAKFVILRPNVRGNWQSDTSRLIEAAIHFSGLQASFDVLTQRVVVAP